MRGVKNAEDRFMTDYNKAKLAQRTLYGIVDDYRTIDTLNINQAEAFQLGARLLEDLGEKAHRDAVIMRYHASYPKAVLVQDAYTRMAIRRAIECIERYIEIQGRTGVWAI